MVLYVLLQMRVQRECLWTVIEVTVLNVFVPWVGSWLVNNTLALLSRPFLPRDIVLGWLEALALIKWVVVPATTCLITSPRTYGLIFFIAANAYILLVWRFVGLGDLQVLYAWVLRLNFIELEEYFVHTQIIIDRHSEKGVYAGQIQVSGQSW